MDDDLGSRQFRASGYLMNPDVAPGRLLDSQPGVAGRGLVTVVRWYRDAVSPALPPRCRFYPTCSSYAVTALQRYGPLRGGWLALRRILRCGPWHPGGVDHVPSVAPSNDLVPPSNDVGLQRCSVSQETAVV